jgi:hypothetical protein
MGLYERILQEAAQGKEKGMENPERERHQRMRAYISSRRRRAVPGGGGGYVTSEEIKEEQEKHLADLQALCGFLIWGVKAPAGGYRLAHLRS